MDDPLELAEAWCEQVGPLCEPPAREGSDCLTPWLDAIGQGLRLRRALDALNPDAPVVETRQKLLRQVTRLQVLAAAELSTLAEGTARRRYVAARVKQRLIEFRAVVRDVVDRPGSSPLNQALAIEGLRADVEWLGLIIARLDHEAPYPITAWMEIELERLRGSLCADPGRGGDPDDRALHAACEQTQVSLLNRRIERELTRPVADANPVALWGQRLQLSRLQAQAAFLGKVARSSEPAANDLDRPGRWLDALEGRRRELAAQADRQIDAVPPRERLDPCARIVQTAIDEAGETVALLEGMPLPRAVKRLGLLRDDIETLVASSRRWSRRGPESPAAPETPGPDDERDGSPPGSLDGSATEQTDSSRGEAANALERARKRLRRHARRVHGEWQERVLALRMDRLLGPRFVAFLENLVLILILALVVELAIEFLLDRASPGGLTARQHRIFAGLDLAICSVFLFEFTLKLCLAPDRTLYFFRHFALDFLASLPFGYLAHTIDLAQLESAAGSASATTALERLVQFGRLARVLRLLRLALPFFRLARVGLILLRLSDRVVGRLAGLLNRNIILFEPREGQRPESSDRHRQLSIRSELEQAKAAIEPRLGAAERRQLALRILSDVDCRLECLPPPVIALAADDEPGREIPVEAVVERLIQMTPERLLDRTGPAFVNSVDRYLRFLDKPLIRRLPGVRNLVAYREKSPAEEVALAANYLGHLIQRALDVIYFFADLQGTLSPPVFLDRLGAAIVNATRTPAKRLLTLGSIFLVLFLLVQVAPLPDSFRLAVDRFQSSLGWPVIIFGVVCLALWQLGAWLRKIANRSADFSERLVEAQFAAHTKSLKSRRREQDAAFLAERVIDPELLLRSADDQVNERPPQAEDGQADRPRLFLFENRELAFLRNVRLLYQDYLDGSPLHRSDTKASVQLLGNLALGNLRRSHLGHFLREGRALDRLDLSRSGGLFGGPYLWFNYITRMLVQETAILILDYNRNAIPCDRLACSPERVRRKFQLWLAGRLKIEPEEVVLPEPATPLRVSPGMAGTDRRDSTDRDQGAAAGDRSTRKEAAALLETVEFTAVDFLSDDRDRHAEITSRFGPQVAELVRRDREQNVRRAFQSFPLHELPLAARTINPFNLYETYLAGGRVVLLPFRMAAHLAKAVFMGLRGIVEVVRAILNPQVDRDRLIPSDTYWAALRKIHRMRKPVFMGSLWLRARFDVEYLGLPLPTAPAGIAGQSLMEADLDYIRATRQDRIIAEQVRRRHYRRLEWVAGWLDRFGWSFDLLPAYLAREIPYLANRGGEALRALVAGCVLDHDDIATLALSIEGLSRAMAYAALATAPLGKLPAGLPDPVVDLRNLWHPVDRCRRPVADLFDLPCFPAYDFSQQKRIRRYLARHQRAFRGWIKVVLGQGGADPWATVNARMRDVLLRTDLWSDQILVLRAVQTLTMLDLQHNCELVWSLGGYTRSDLGDVPGDTEPPATLLRREPAREASAAR